MHLCVVYSSVEILLQMRKNAILITRLFISKGLDPLVMNEDGEDFFVTMREQYAEQSLILKQVQAELLESLHTVLVPTATAALHEREQMILQQLRNMIFLIHELREIMKKRVSKKEQYEWLKKRSILKNEVFYESRMISQALCHIGNIQK